MSVLTRKPSVNEASGLRAQAAYAARQVAPLATKTVPLAQQAAMQAQLAAQQAAPLARTAGTSVRQGADGAIAWATPRVDAARSWAAPQIEQSARAISENLAPMITSALITAAHKIDAPPRKKARHRRGGKLTGMVLLTTAAAAGALVAMRLRRRPEDFSQAPPADRGSDLGPVNAGGEGFGPTGGLDDDVTPDPDMNGNPNKIV